MDDISLETIPEYLYARYKYHPDREAFIFAHTDGSRTVVTFGDLYEKSNILAKSFIALGVEKTDFIAVSLRNCPEWLYATFGAILAGARPISLSFTYTDGSDVVAMMKKLEKCSTIVLDPAEDVDTWKIFLKLITHFDKNGNVGSNVMPYLKFLVCRHGLTGSDSVLTIEEMMKWKTQDIKLPTVKPDDILALFQTSGSTGFPKACVHTNRSAITGLTITQVGKKMSEQQAFRMFNDRPFTWSGGFPYNLITGETRVTRLGYSEPPADEIEFIIDVIKKENCIIFGVLPQLLHKLIEQQDKLGTDWPVQLVATGGQPMSKKFAACLEKVCKHVVIGYGSTELLASSVYIIDSPSDFKEYAIGYPYKGVQIKICDENEQALPTNQIGEIYVKGDGLFKEYFNDPEKTKASFTEDGWFKTNDIGYMTEDGLFFCEGRQSETIISGGMNVTPTILESSIRNCPGVSRVVCVPVADDVMYQVICACIISQDGSEVTEAKLRQYCDDIHNDKSRLFTVVPKYYMFLDDFPLTYSGKVSRKELTKMAAERFLSV